VTEHSEERDPAAEGEQDEKELLEDIDPADEESSDVRGGARQGRKRSGPLQ
jgi:hypothetical protein